MKQPLLYLLIILTTLSCNQATEKTSNKASAADSIESLADTEEMVKEDISVIKVISTAELELLRTNNDQLIIVDVRQPAETKHGIIEGALTGMNFLSGEFENNITQFDSTKSIVVYCARGGRSAKAAQILATKGFKTVYDYTDGYKGWAVEQSKKK